MSAPPGPEVTTIGNELLSVALRHARDAEIFWAREEATGAACVGSDESEPSHREGEGMALRIIGSGRIGFAVHLGPLSSLHPPALLKEAVQKAARGPEAPPTFWKEREVVPLSWNWDERVAALGAVDLRRMALQASMRLHDMLGDVPRQVVVRRAVRHLAILSRTSEKHAQKTLLQFQVQAGVPAVPTATLLHTWASCAAPDDPMALLGSLPWKAACASFVAAVAPGTMPVVLSPRAAGTLLRWLSAGFLGSRLVEGTSPLVDRAGQRLFDARLSLADDPTIPWNSAGGAFDAEGVARRRQVLIHRGVVTGSLLDLASAHRLQMTPTGSAARTMDTPPEAAPSCLDVPLGDHGFEDLLALGEGGLYIEALDEEAAPDLVGNFTSAIREGFAIQGGRPVGWVEDLALQGNVYQMFASQLLGTGSDVVVGLAARTGSLAFGDVEVVPQVVE